MFRPEMDKKAGGVIWLPLQYSAKGPKLIVLIELQSQAISKWLLEQQCWFGIETAQNSKLSAFDQNSKQVEHLV